VSTDSYDLDLDGPERDAIVVQAGGDIELAGEVIAPGETVSLAGRDFRVAEKVGLMPLLKFSHAANLSTSDERAYVAMYQILRDVIKAADHPCGNCEGCKTVEGREATARDCMVADKGDWDSFEEWAVDCKADADELLDVVSEAIKVISARPTVSPSGSSDTSRRSSRRSTDGRSLPPGGASRTSRRGKRAT
jgi:hypothetical protein